MYFPFRAVNATESIASSDEQPADATQIATAAIPPLTTSAIQSYTVEAKKMMESLVVAKASSSGANSASSSNTTSSTDDNKKVADSKDVLRRACAAVGSLKELEFDIRFNADVFSADIEHVDDENAPNSLRKQKKLITDAAQFLLLTQIPNFVRDCMDHSSAPMDGNTLTEVLHSRGINVRYLGKVAVLLAKIPKLEYLYTISVQELIVRAAKHIFYTYMQNTDLMNLASAISHFLNCFLATVQPLSPVLGHEELMVHHKSGGSAGSTKKQRNNKKKGNAASTNVTTSTSATNGSNGKAITADHSIEWAQLSQKSLWQAIRKELKQYWDFDLGCDNIEAAVDQYRFHKLSLMRAFCLKVGVQMLLREYNFESRNKATFNEDDIVNVFPIVKHISPRASDAFNFFTTGQSKIQQGSFKEGFELISEALNLLNNVYGAMHSENAQCLRMLARLSYIMGDPQEALAIQQRAVLMSERVNGIDHPYTITEYVSFEFHFVKNIFIYIYVFLYNS